MSSFYQDQALLDALVDADPAKEPSPNVFSLDILDWFQGPGGDYDFTQRKSTISELDELPTPALRIIFLPLIRLNGGNMENFLRLFDYYAVPSAFLAGRLRSTTHSFGALNNIEGYNCSWFHYLCKNVNIAEDSDGKSSISDPRQDVPKLEHNDSTWIRSGYFLRCAEDSSRGPEVTLLCFESSPYLKERLGQISPTSISTTVALDPYSLFVIVMEELSLQMDDTVWDVMNIFREVELDALTTADNRTSFTGLHNVSKQILFLQESCEAVMCTLKAMMSHHQRILQEASAPKHNAAELAHGMLGHIETHFQSTNLRLKSLEKRMENIIALSFHLVTQDGNRIMQKDGNSMATIAFVTLIFLPMSTVSTIFGGQFFQFDEHLVRVSESFWVFWLVSIPLTLAVLFFWRVSIGRVSVPEFYSKLNRKS